MYGGTDGDFVDYMAAATLATYGDFPDAINSGSIAVPIDYDSYGFSAPADGGTMTSLQTPHAFPSAYPEVLEGSFRNS